MSADEQWMSTAEVGLALGLSEATVRRRFATPDEADAEWGAGNWREKPHVKRRMFQVKRSAVEAKKA